MFQIFWRTILDRRRSLIVYLLAGVGLIWLYVITYPTVQATSAEISDLAQALPPALTEAFGIDPRSFITFEGFMAGKHFSMVWPMMMVMLVAGFAAGSIAGDVEKGTMELVLSQPISRTKVIFARIMSGVTINLIFALVSVLSVVPIANAYNIDIAQENFVLLTAIGFLFGLAVFGISMLASAFFSEKGKALFVIIGVLLSMYVINIVALLKASLENAKFASYFYYFDYTGMLLDGKIGTLSIAVFLVAFVALAVASTVRFVRRDIVS